MMLSKFVFVILACFVLAGCGLFREDIEISTAPKIIVDHPAPPRPLTLREVEWAVLNKERLQELLDSPESDNIVIFAITSKGYENLSLNVNELKRYIEAQKEIIIFYRKTLNRIEDRLENKEK